MKKTKQIMLSAFIMIGLFASVVITSCTKTTSDPCQSVTCSNGGVCTQGICSCPSGYSGISCQTAANAAFVGTWRGSNCTGNAVVSTSAMSNPLQFNIPLPLNFSSCGSLNENLTGNIVEGTETFSTNTISVEDNCGNIYAININGSVAGNSIVMTYNIATSAGLSHCSFTGTQ